MVNSILETSKTSSICTVKIIFDCKFLFSIELLIFIIASFIISAAEPCIGALMAFRSACPCTTEFLELISKRIITSYPAIIPNTEWDRLTMLNNEEMDIVIVAFDEYYLRFSLPYESEVLTMSLEKVSIIKNKFGEIVYP